jgi:polyhydroxybutyrate depolymerase
VKKRALFFASVVTSLLAILWHVGCSSDQELPSSSLTVSDLERSYNLFVPTNVPSTPMPLILAFHGGGGSGEPFPQQEQFEALAEAQGFVMAFPQGYLLSGNEGEWQLNTRPDARHDIDFVAAVIDDIASTHSIDSSRIYAIGYSLGSMLTYEVACHMSDRFAAIASFAGTMPVSPASCEPERFAPVMHIHGIDDSIIAYGHTWGWKSWDEVGTMMDIPSLVTYWASKYNCQNESETASANSAHIVHDACDQNSRVEHHRLSGGGHGWPESINGTSTPQVIWSFLSGTALP